MKPLQLYLIINVIYFLFLRNFDAYFIRLEYVALENDYLSVQATKMAKEKAARQHIPFDLPKESKLSAPAHTTTNTFVSEFNHKAPDYGKAFLLLQLPVLALACYLMYFYKQKMFVPHLIYTTHIFTAALAISFLYIVLIGKPLMYYANDFFVAHRKLIWTVSTLLIAIYLAFAARRIYRENWVITIVKTFVFMFVYGMVFNYYRTFITYVTIWLM